jgi:uncharacterized protein
MSGRFRRWIPCFLTVLLILGMGMMKAHAEEMMELDGASSQRVYDMAELLSKEEEEEFETAIENARKSLGFDIVVVTIEDAGGRNAQDYADYNYEAAGFGHGDSHDGILFLVDMDNRELVLSTEGKAIRIFTDERIERMLDDVYERASEDEFADSVRAFLRDVEYYGEKGISSGQYNYDTETHQISTYKSIRWYEALLALGVSGFVAVAACLTVKRQYAMEEDPKHLKNLNMAYRGDCNFAFRNQQDVFVNKFVTTQVIPRNTSGSGGLGGSSSAGRSSTHHSSSGRTHGGGSRKF